jgi:hypothetical protein
MATQWSREFRGTSRQFPMGLLAVVGVLLGAVTIAYLVEHPFLTEHPYSELIKRTEIGVVALLSAAVVATAYSLSQSQYSATDLWAIFGWSVAGMLSSVGVAGGIYAHQVLRDGALADRMFLFEELALVGLVAGIGFGVTRQTAVRANTRTDTPAVDGYALTAALGDDSEMLDRRLAVVEHLVDTTTNELPLAALAAKLSAEDVRVFPDEKQAVAQMLETEVVPELVDAEVVQVHDDIETVEYVGPPALAESLSGSRPQ